jgi:diketogulonate reductase-like aldo/keto reductase
MVNQFELHPGYVPEETIEWCRKHSVVIQAYSSLARGELLTDAMRLKHPILKDAADRHGKTTAQVLLRWAWQHDFCIIPKSISPERIEQNADIDFVLGGDEISALDSIHKSSPLKVCWDPKPVV